MDNNGNCLLEAFLIGCSEQKRLLERFSENQQLRSIVTLFSKERSRAIQELREKGVKVGLKNCPEQELEIVYTEVRIAIQDLKIGDDNPLKEQVDVLQALAEADENQRKILNLFADYVGNDQVFLDGFPLAALAMSFQIPIKIVNEAGIEIRNNFDLLGNIRPEEDLCVTLVHGSNHYQPEFWV